jgi:hypothetical protein
MKIIIIFILFYCASLFAQDDYLVFVGEFIESEQVTQNLPEGYITFSVKDKTLYRVIEVLSPSSSQKILKQNEEIVIYSNDSGLVDKHQFHNTSLIIAKTKGKKNILDEHFQVHKTKNGNYASCANEPLIYGDYQHMDSKAKSINFDPPVILEYTTYLTQDYINESIVKEGIYLNKGRLICGKGLYTIDLYKEYSKNHNSGSSYHE